MVTYNQGEFNINWLHVYAWDPAFSGKVNTEIRLREQALERYFAFRNAIKPMEEQKSVYSSVMSEFDLSDMSILSIPLVPYDCDSPLQPLPENVDWSIPDERESGDDSCKHEAL